ncbi:hypothetical protein SAMN05421812_110255 [Asanoa hainanensis]|uniref:Uncharacterized protein n=1 Tax=Asanoa hainanensis TaxID=560556 RepID=A0A239NT90_9ACTN|nr:hypothetical protein [Asanoa hainanensis]SNT58131.1 hypothetical protein SAMN05421812_110255 [Asanoa hainanensis]
MPRLLINGELRCPTSQGAVRGAFLKRGGAHGLLAAVRRHGDGTQLSGAEFIYANGRVAGGRTIVVRLDDYAEDFYS